MFSVTISDKGGQQNSQEFSKTEITIGRVRGNDIVLPKTNVSKQHTRISFRDNGFFIVDLNSTNGTYVNGMKVTQERRISEQDKIYIGDFILQVQPMGAQAQPGPPQPPQPPGAQAPGQGGHQGRHFPTVMDGPKPGNRPMPPSPPPTGALPAASMNPPNQPTPAPQRNPSASGFGASFPEVAQENLTPVPGSQPGAGRSPTPAPLHVQEDDDLRRTVGDAAAALNYTEFDDLDALEEIPLTPEPLGASRTSAPRPGSIGSSALASQKPLQSEFDEDFHQAQQDVARVFFEQVPPHELSLSYPIPQGAERTRLESAAQNAIQTVSPQVDRQLLKDRFISQLLGLGPIETYLDDPTVQSIYVNGHDRIVLRREGQLVVAPFAFADPHLLDVAARRLLGPQEPTPLSDEVRFNDGTRVHILMPPLAADGPILTVRKPRKEFLSLAELADEGVLSAGMAEFLRRAVDAGRCLLIAGPTSAGKSTMLAALAQEVAPSSRMIAVEEYSQIPLTAPSFLRLEASPSSGVDLRFLLQSAMNMHPDRILLDECRGPEGYAWVTAAASGTEGSMITLHGTSATDALGRLESMCLLGAGELSARGLREQIARAVDLIIVLHATQEGSFRVHQISELQGVDLDAFRVNDVFYFRVEGSAGGFHPTGYIPLFYEDLRHAGLDVDLELFRE